MSFNIEKMLKGDSLFKMLWIFGEEDYLVDETQKKILNFAKKLNYNDYSIEYFEAGQIDENEIVDISNSNSLVSEKRLIIIKDFDKLFKKKNKSAKRLLNYFINPNNDTSILFLGAPSNLKGISRELLNSKKKSAALKKINVIPEFAKFLIENDLYLDFPKVYEDKYLDWIINKTKSDGKKLNIEAAKLILSSSQVSLRDINNELNKIYNNLDDKSEIQIQDVEKILSVSRDYNIFELLNQIGFKDTKKTISILENLYTKSNPSVFLIVTLSRYFYSLLILCEAYKKTQDKFKLASMIGVNPYFIINYTNAIKKFTKSEIEQILIELANTDEKLKSSSGSQKLLVEKLIVNILTDFYKK